MPLKNTTPRLQEFFRVYTEMIVVYGMYPSLTMPCMRYDC